MSNEYFGLPGVARDDSNEVLKIVLRRNVKFDDLNVLEHLNTATRPIFLSICRKLKNEASS